MSNVQIVGIAGRKRAGKSTLSQWLVDHHGFLEVSFAGPLKNMLDQLFYDLDVGTTEPNPLYHDKDTPRADLFGLAPRDFMQTLGTEWGRECIHPDLWVIAAEREIAKLKRCTNGTLKIAIPDLRFKNELEWIRGQGGMTVWIENNSIDLSDQHISERSIERSDTNHIITNNFSTPELFCQTASEYVLSLLEESNVR